MNTVETLFYKNEVLKKINGAFIIFLTMLLIKGDNLKDENNEILYKNAAVIFSLLMQKEIEEFKPFIPDFYDKGKTSLYYQIN